MEVFSGCRAIVCVQLLCRVEKKDRCERAAHVKCNSERVGEREHHSARESKRAREQERERARGGRGIHGGGLFAAVNGTIEGSRALQREGVAAQRRRRSDEGPAGSSTI